KRSLRPKAADICAPGYITMPMFTCFIVGIASDYVDYAIGKCLRPERYSMQHPPDQKEKLMSKRAILVVDLQNEYWPTGNLPLQGIEAAAANAARVMDHARAKGDLVVN